MNNAELYQKSNTLQKRDAQQCLEEYAKKIKWKNYGDTVIDIGCGDGSVTTSILKNFVPDYCKMLVGCDVSEKMVHFANIHHGEDFVRFMVLDIESDLPEQLREKFEHAFSFYSLHWIKHQEIAFRNIYDLLTREGQCLLMFLGHMPLYDVFRRLSRSPRWNYWMKNIEGFVSPYHDCQDPEKNIKAMTTAIGFTNVEVKCLQKEFVYRGAEVLKNAMSAINPFEIPLDMQEDFLEDFIKIIRDKEIVESSIEVDDTFNIKDQNTHLEDHSELYHTTIPVYLILFGASILCIYLAYRRLRLQHIKRNNSTENKNIQDKSEVHPHEIRVDPSNIAATLSRNSC